MAKPVPEREQERAASALAVVERESTQDTEAMAAVRGLRRLAAKHGCGIADLIGGGAAALRRELQEVTHERNALRRAVAKLERANEARIAGANEAREAAARRYAREVWNNHIAEIRRERPGITSTGIAEELTRRKVPTPQGAETWSRQQVHRVAEWLGYRL